jgi:choline dehydrogenase-like flavoprotein
LLEQGRRVTMLDGGVRLEEDRAAVVRRLGEMPSEDWPESALDVLKEGMESGLGGIPLKRVYGSDFPYRDTERFADLRCNGADMTFSLALGGLSNVWGAAVLPFTEDDIDDWPIGLDDLAPYYERVLRDIPLSAAPDGLSRSLPLYSDRAVPLKLSRQAEALLDDLSASKERLAQRGIAFGRSRLAVRAAREGGKPGCVYCGLCLYGCPYDLIYNSSHALQALLADPNFTYIPDTIVERVAETSTGVTAFTKSRVTGERATFDADRLFLGCGVLPTTKILLESLDMFDKPVTLKDSQYVLIPFLRMKGEKDVRKEPLHTLAQLCLEISDPLVSPRSVHVGVYSYSDLFDSALREIGRAHV